MGAARCRPARNVGVDLAKLIACGGVLFIHLIGRDSSPVNGSLFFLAGFAVPVFFMANGYFVLNRRRLGYSYVLGKVRSVLAVAALWVALWWAAMCVKDRAFADPLALLANSLLGTGSLSWFRFFGALVLVQLLSPLIARVNAVSPRAQAALLAVAVLSCLGVHAWDLVAATSGSQGVLAVPEALRLWTWCSYFLGGGVLGSPRFKEWAGGRVSRVASLAAVAASACAVVAVQYALGCCHLGIRWPEHFYDSPTTMVFALSVFIACDLYPPKRLVEGLRDSGAVAKLSDCIMGIYIVHPFFWQLVQRFYGLGDPLVNFAVVVNVLAAAFAVTYCLKRFSYANRLVKL